MNFLRGKLIAHRGIFNENEIIENTIEAFQKAIELGYPIELDVHVVKDKQVIVFHDNNLKRMAGKNVKIKDCTYEQLKKLVKFSIPTLEEVLTLIQNKVPILIELKYDQKVGVLERELVKQLDKYQGEFAVQSFHPLSIYWFRKNRKHYIRGQLVTVHHAILKKLFLQSMFFNFLTKPDFISCHKDLIGKKKIQNLRKKNLILAWTIKGKNEHQKYEGEADGFICENLEKF